MASFLYALIVYKLIGKEPTMKNVFDVGCGLWCGEIRLLDCVIHITIEN